MACLWHWRSSWGWHRPPDGVWLGGCWAGWWVTHWRHVCHPGPTHQRPDPRLRGRMGVGVRASGTAVARPGPWGLREGGGHVDRGWWEPSGEHLGGSSPCCRSAAGAAQAEPLGWAALGPGVRTAGCWALRHGTVQLRNPEEFDASRASTSPWSNNRISLWLLLPDSLYLSQAA